MTKEQIIEQLETSLNEYKGLGEAIDDAAFYIAAEFDKLKDYSVAKEENSIEAKQRAANYMSLKGALEPKQETLEEVKDLNFWRNNCEENYITTPISVLRYISELEKEQERSYSEQEVIDLIQFLSMNQNFNDYSSVSKETAKYFIKQFKKKYAYLQYYCR